MKLRINEVFRDLLPKLSSDQITSLAEDINTNGILNPIITWNGVILDGHHRYQIAQSCGIDFETKEIKLTSTDDAKLWIIKHQRDRRNMTRKDIDKLMVDMYEILKKDAGGNGSNQFSKGIKMTPKQKTAEIVAEEFGVSPATVNRKVKQAKQENEMISDVELLGDNYSKVFQAYNSLDKSIPARDRCTIIGEKFNIMTSNIERLLTMKRRSHNDIISDIFNKKISIRQAGIESSNLYKKQKKDGVAAEIKTQYKGHPIWEKLKNDKEHIAMTYEEFNEPEFYKKYIKGNKIKSAEYIFIEKSLLLKNPFTEHHMPRKNFAFYTRYWINKTTRPISYEHIENLEPKIFISNVNADGNSIAEWLVDNFKAIKTNG